MKKTYVAGPLYWVTETGAVGKIFGWAFFAEVQPPFRFGNGLRLRIGSRALQVGICRKAPRSLIHDVDVDPEEIGKW